MPSTVQMVQEHVPAWKKLGLKLKNAKDEPAIVNEDQASSANKKRKIPIEDYAEQIAIRLPSKKRAKKPKKSASTSSEPPVTATRDTASPALPPQEKNRQPPFLPKTSPRKRKSVSFAAETKIEDADSTKDLYNTWLTSELTSDPSFDPSKTASPALKSITSSSIPGSTAAAGPVSYRTPKRKKKKKKSKSTTLTQSSEQPSNPTNNDPPTNLNKATLDYLQIYYTNRPAWKFSKIRQTQLLRSLFPSPPSLPSSTTTTPIPNSHLPALHAYLTGLQGQSARQRLRTQALAVREVDENWPADAEGNMEAVQSKERRREEYLKEVERVKEMLEGVEDAREDKDEMDDTEWWNRVQRRRMAEIVLWSVGEPEPETQKAVKGSELGPVAGVKRPSGKNGKPKRKRKRRTTGVPDDESSSSSSSSSSSDSESEEEDGKKEAAVKKPKPTEGSSETSSSDPDQGSGSESSSDGENGSDSGSSSSGTGTGSSSGSESEE